MGGTNRPLSMVDKVSSENSPHPVNRTSRSSTITKTEPNYNRESKDERENEIEASAPQPPPSEIEYPEGGLRAWLVVLGGGLITFSTFGFVNAWVFQEYYSRTLLKDQSLSNIAWIGSIQYALVLMPGVISGRLFDIGYFRESLLPASCIFVAATFFVAECKKYWQFVLAQGIALGISSGFLFGPSLPVAAHYFRKKRPQIYGLVALGSSIGGTVLPIATRNLIPKVGFPWTMRILGFIFLLTTGTANILLKRRLPPTNIKGGLFNFRAFKIPHLSLLYAASVIGFLGMFTVLTYMDVAAVGIGINSDLAFYLVAIANASSSIGRVGMGILAAWVGPLNVLLCFCALGAVMTYAWPFAHSAGALIAVAIIYGIATGAFVGLIAVPLSHPEFGVQGDLGRRIGMLFTVSGIGALCGPPISGAVHDAVGGYKAVGAYAGSILLFATALLFATKWVAIRSIWAKF